jgi:tRNA (adenine22-N1)-methyltransferase
MQPLGKYNLRHSSRLEAVASMVPHGSRVADIGTDHGLLPLLLLSGGRASHCIASDVKSGWPGGTSPSDRLELRAGTGLQVLKPEDCIDVVAITGVGGRSIRRILDDACRHSLDIRLAVVQPQSEAAEVRRWLAEQRYPIVAESVVFERGRYYFIMAAELDRGDGWHQHPLLDRDDLVEAGPLLVRSGDPLVRSYWLQVRERQRAIRRGEASARLALAERVLQALP